MTLQQYDNKKGMYSCNAIKSKYRQRYLTSYTKYLFYEIVSYGTLSVHVLLFIIIETKIYKIIRVLKSSFRKM